MTAFCRAGARAGLLMAVLLGGSCPAGAAERLDPSWWGVVSHVVDGDTVRVRPAEGGKPVSVRIQGIDAPEICQSAGAASREALNRLALGQRVAVYGARHDDYGRLLARIELRGEDLGAAMVAQGLAWSYHYRGNPGAYLVQQRQARAAALGMFSPAYVQPPVYPAAFRRQHGSCYPQSSSRRVAQRRKTGKGRK